MLVMIGAVNAQVKIKFQVDMSNVKGEYKAPIIFGNFNNWGEGVNTKSIGDGIYEGVVKTDRKFKPGSKIYWGARYWKVNKNVYENIPKECGGDSNANLAPNAFRTSIAPKSGEIYRWEFGGCRINVN